jgi:hypothetical protein
LPQRLAGFCRVSLSTNVIISFYLIFLIFWVGIFIADIFSFEWFQNIIKAIDAAKLAAK